MAPRPFQAHFDRPSLQQAPSARVLDTRPHHCTPVWAVLAAHGWLHVVLYAFRKERRAASRSAATSGCTPLVDNRTRAPVPAFLPWHSARKRFAPICSPRRARAFFSTRLDNFCTAVCPRVCQALGYWSTDWRGAASRALCAAFWVLCLSHRFEAEFVAAARRQRMSGRIVNWGWTADQRVAMVMEFRLTGGCDTAARSASP